MTVIKRDLPLVSSPPPKLLEWPSRNRADLAKKLLLIAARRSTETYLGWAHPDCQLLQEAAMMLRGEPHPVKPEIVEGVLS